MLSLNKLERLLATKGFVIKKIYSVNGLCVYLEILSIENADMFILYISSKYDIPVDGRKEVYKINYIEMDDLQSIAENYAQEPDNLDLEMVYEEIDIDMSPDKKHKDDLAKHLEESYKRPISLKDVTKKDVKDLKDIKRQLNRLRFCVQNVKYKIAIQYKNYMCCVGRDDTVNSYLIKHFSGEDKNKMFVLVDIETLYNKLETIQMDLKSVREGIYRVLDKNQVSHTRTLQKLLDERRDVLSFSDHISKKKEVYSAYIAQLEDILSKLSAVEKAKITKLVELDGKNDDGGIKGLHSDIQRSHMVNTYQTELEKIGEIKHDLIKNLFALTSKREDMFLFVDKLLFDNSVMVDAVIKNMSKATQYTN